VAWLPRQSSPPGASEPKEVPMNIQTKQTEAQVFEAVLSAEDSPLSAT
jgi:hypothetical protein